MSNILIELKKNKSLKYYLNTIPFDIIKIINNNIEFKKRFLIKNHIKLNKKVLRDIKYKIKINENFNNNNIIKFYNLNISKKAINKNYNNIYYKNHINRAQFYVITLYDINRKVKANKKLK